MATNLLALLGLVALCVFWAVFQLWLSKRDPDAGNRHAGCGACNGDCEK